MLFGSNGNTYTVCTESGVFIYAYCSQYRDAGRGKEIKKKTRRKRAKVKVACQANLSERHFGHACHRFVSPALVAGLGIAIVMGLQFQFLSIK